MKPAAEVEVDEPLVRRLLAEQFPMWADRPLTLVASGWDNVIYRLGEDLSVRLPRRAVAAPLVLHEQQWLPSLASRLPLAVPTPVGIGVPSALYPWHWSVCPWFPGRPALVAPFADPAHAARQLGDFVRAMHQPAPADAPPNPYRGVPLADRDEATRERIEQLHDVIDGPAALACWEACSAAPAWDGPPLWLHGDLHPQNVLVVEGEIAAIIDFGDITAGDPATDLAAAWVLLPPSVRAGFRRAAGDHDEATWTRARGWALSLGVAYTASSADAPDFLRLGRQVVAPAIAD